MTAAHAGPPATLLRPMLQVCKVYIGSFNASNPIRDDVNPHGKELFEKEQANLLQDLFEIPQRSTDRKVGRRTPTADRQQGQHTANGWSCHTPVSVPGLS